MDRLIRTDHVAFTSGDWSRMVEIVVTVCSSAHSHKCMLRLGTSGKLGRLWAIGKKYVFQYLLSCRFLADV